MRRSKIHFEQIPLEAIGKVAGRQASKKKWRPKRHANVLKTHSIRFPSKYSGSSWAGFQEGADAGPRELV
jgi:hypothetical protein